MRAMLITSTTTACLCLASTGSAQIVCDGAGPDAAIGLFTGPANYPSLNGVEAFSIGPTICNLGDQPLAMVAAPSTQHSILTQNLYRLATVDGATRFEHIGMSWVFHTFFVLTTQVCCTDCVPVDSQHLGPRCSCPETASLMGAQSGLTPRWQVNPVTGLAPQPPANPPFTGSVDRRLQAKITDIDPAQNPSAQYFAEVIIFGPDDAAAGNQNNNASHRPAAFTGSGAAFSLAFTGAMNPGLPAISAWQAADPNVIETTIDIPSDGRLILAANATAISKDLWRYEYALFNFNADRAARSFSIPIPAGATISNIGFHDVDYHSGDGLASTTDGTDWPATVTATEVTWNTQPFAQNPNANALRWGTLYNFRFDADVPPAAKLGDAVINTFKVEGQVSAATIVPGAVALCSADIAPQGPPPGNGTVDVDDLLLVINSWGQIGITAADITQNQIVDVDDLLAVINAWGACQ